MTRFDFRGLDALKQGLRQLPSELTGEGGDIVEQHTEQAARHLRAAYPEGDTGRLRAGVKTTIDRSRFGVVGIVRSRAKHAHLWEWGTQVRTTRQGWFRGVMPAAGQEGLVPIAVRTRRAMNKRLFDLVRQAGFQVG